MDWWKLFSGTFILIFLAELGDKTQLAALAKTADAPDSSMAKWIVFFGASAALVTSTFIAVFLGGALKSLVPDERYIRIAAALLFLVFGFSILRETYLSFKAGDAPAAVVKERKDGDRQTGEVGFIGGLALRAAMDFEALSRDRYQRIADSASPALSRLLQELAREEESHLVHLMELNDKERSDSVWRRPIPTSGISGRALESDIADAGMVRNLIAHEQATADFYRNLAESTLIPSVRSILLHLAAEEDQHAERLRSFT